MSGRLGAPFSQVAPAAASGASGRVMTFTQAVALCSIYAVWVSTATLTNRAVQIQIKDASGNLLLALPAFVGIPPSQTTNLIAINGAAFTSFTGPPIGQTMPLAVDAAIPAGGSITVIDTAHVDNADTCSIAVTGSN